MKYAIPIYWNSLPFDKENAVTYPQLCIMWNCNARQARAILHELSLYDNGDNYILIRSSKGKGFYKTDEEDEIRRYKGECVKKAISILEGTNKINRILNEKNRASNQKG